MGLYSVHVSIAITEQAWEWPELERHLEEMEPAFGSSAITLLQISDEHMGMMVSVDTTTPFDAGQHALMCVSHLMDRLEVQPTRAMEIEIEDMSHHDKQTMLVEIEFELEQAQHAAKRLQCILASSSYEGVHVGVYSGTNTLWVSYYDQVRNPYTAHIEAEQVITGHLLSLGWSAPPMRTRCMALPEGIDYIMTSPWL